MNRVFPIDDSDGACVLAIVKDGGETYVIAYDDAPEPRRNALAQLVRWAINDDLSFNWQDCFAGTNRIHKLTKEE